MLTYCPLSPSSTPLYLIAGAPRRAGTDADRKSWLPPKVSVKAIPFSSSRTTGTHVLPAPHSVSLLQAFVASLLQAPSALTTWNTALALTADADVASGSRMFAVTLSEQEYWYLSRRAALPGRECGWRFHVCVWPVNPNTGPAITSANGWPPASRRPSAASPAEPSSPGSSRPLPLASSFAPLMAVICPGVAPPTPRRTRTFHVPVGSWFVDTGAITDDVRCTASMLLYLSCTEGVATWWPLDHCPISAAWPTM